MKTPQEYIIEARQQMLNEVKRVQFPFSIIKKQGAKQKNFKILDREDGEGGASVYIGQLKSGTSRGKWGVYVASYDFDTYLRSRNVYDSEEEATKIMDSIGPKKSEDDLYKTFRHIDD